MHNYGIYCGDICILIDIQKTNLNNYSFADIKYFIFVDVSFQRFFLVMFYFKQSKLP